MLGSTGKGVVVPGLSVKTRQWAMTQTLMLGLTYFFIISVCLWRKDTNYF